MKAYRFPEYDTPVFDCKDKVVAVFGGGNTAMDSVRTAKRLGAREAMIIYRRSEAELPCRKEEYGHAKEEGIHFTFLANPIEFLGTLGGLAEERALAAHGIGRAGCLGAAPSGAGGRFGIRAGDRYGYYRRGQRFQSAHPADHA